ncbi:hypothetical protein Bpfe_018395 [Biomphalaria pfeifferi]|uniref:Uncharacterized protein n=1 Tax=Biomphalaria pfeifferi TaxID=112525 RepID=A0AAD8BDK2_BIOPF|nr:hypothetical protein Bpfe_018395 [Biomphalaria pfeifferi]
MSPGLTSLRSQNSGRWGETKEVTGDLSCSATSNCFQKIVITYVGGALVRLVLGRHCHRDVISAARSGMGVF